MLNNDILNNFALESAAIIPIITAIVQAFKFSTWVKDKYAPFLSMIVGVGVTFLMAHDLANNISGTILLGLLFGLAASGLYAGLSSTTQAIRAEKAERARKQQEKHQKQQSKQGAQDMDRQNINNSDKCK